MAGCRQGHRTTMVKLFFGILLIVIFLISFNWHRQYFQEPMRYFLQTCLAPVNQERPLTPPPPKTKLQLEIDAIFNKIERRIPKVTFTNFNQTTSARNSKTSIVNQWEIYCNGEQLVVQIDMYDHSGNRKTYGGDFIRPRLISPELGAAISGTVRDFNNGSYHVHFPLYWIGKVKVHILLFYPSEGVAALWRSRHSSQGVIGFQGKFEKFGKEALTTCGFKLPKVDGKEICDYRDEEYEEVFQCYKFYNFTCESLNEMRGYDLQASYLTLEEKKIFQRYQSHHGFHNCKGEVHLRCYRDTFR